MIKQNFYLFKNIKQCFLTYLIFIICSVGRILISGISLYIYMGNSMDIVNVLQDTLLTALFGVIIFMYITYEYLVQGKRCFAEECLSTLPISKSTQEITQLVICVFLGLIYTVCMYIVNIIFYLLLHVDRPEYILYISNSLIIYLFLPIVIAILIGGMISYIKNDLFSYSLLVVITMYFTIRFYQISYDIETLFGISDFSQMFGVFFGHVAQYGFLFPLELHFIVKPFYMIGMLLIVLAFIIYYRTRNKRIIPFQIGIGICIVFSIILWKQPCSGCYYEYEDKELYIYQDETIEMESSSDDNFYVEEYNMVLDIDGGLFAKVEMVISDTSCPEYVFTFFSQYKIDSITDQHGNDLEYEQDENFLIIKNTGGLLEKISMSYTGAQVNKYFAGDKGMYLPGNFPFYPIAGKHPIYYQGLCELPKQESQFYVVVNSNNDVYSNLEVNNNVLSGRSNNLTMVSGYWEEKEIHGIDMIYPYISAYYNPELNDYLMNGILEYYEKDIGDKKIDYDLKGKKILIAPFGFEAGNYMYGSDIIIISGRVELDKYYSYYISTGKWHIHDNMSKEEIKKFLEDNPD